MVSEFSLKGFPEVVVKVSENELFEDSNYQAVCGNDNVEYAIQKNYLGNKQIVEAVYAAFKDKYPPAK